MQFDGVINRIDRHYRHYRKRGEAHSGMEEYLRKVMVEHTCPDCDGSKLKRQRLLVTINDKHIHELGDIHLEELKVFLEGITSIPEQKREAGIRVIKELTTRIELLLGIGPRLSQPQPAVSHAFGWGIATYSSLNADWFWLDGNAVCTGRTDDWTSPKR